MRLDAPATAGPLRLEPFADDLREAVRSALDVDAEAWAVMSTTAMGEAFDAWWAAARAEQARGARVPFAVRMDGRVVGTTSFLAIRLEHRAVEIGATFYRPEVRAGVLNPLCKRLMLQTTFDAGAERVEFMIDTRNLRSQAAVAKLGAVREGVLRRSKITWTGFVRDTAVYSILPAEWPQVRERLDARIAAAAG